MSAVVDAGVRLHVYRELAEHGVAPTTAATAEALGLDPSEAAAAYRRLAAAHAIVLEPGTDDVWMAAPFSARPTGFRVRSGDRQWFGNCVWDAAAIPPMLGVDGTVMSTCPDCDEPLELDVRDGSLHGPAGAVAHFAVPAARWWEDIGFT